MRRIIYALALVIALAGLTGCGGTPAAKHTSSPTPSSASAAPTSPTPVDTPPAVEETPTPTSEEPAVAKVGPAEWFTYADGLKVQVTRLARFSKGVIATVTIRNGTKKTVDVSTALVHMTAGPNGDEIEAVYDMEQNLGLGFTGSIPPGRAKTARFGFAVPKAQQKQIGVEVQPGFLDYESCHFEGAVK